MGAPNARHFRYLFAAAVALSACGRDTTVPVRAPAPAARPALADADGSYVLLFRARAVPSNLGARVAALGGTIRYTHPVGIAIVDGLDATGAAQLQASADVAQVEPNTEVSLPQPQVSAPVALSAPVAQSQGNPATAILGSWQWNLRAIGVDKLWPRGKLGSSAVTVAILDTGLDYNSLDLNGLVDLSRSASFVPTDDSITVKFFPTRNLITDYNGHGTNVGSVVSSKAVAFAGVSSFTTLIGVKVLGANGRGSFGGILAGVLWAADHGADVANLSLGGSFGRAGNGDAIETIGRVFNYAGSKGTLAVVAAGNDATDLTPDATFDAFCTIQQVVCVSAVGPVVAGGNPDLFAFYSNFGHPIDVAGPGGNGNGTVSNWPWGADNISWVWSMCSKTLLAGFQSNGTPVLAGCQAGNLILGFIGTSQATPHVAGLAALLVADLGKGKPALIRKVIENTADPLGTGRGDPRFGKGRINAARAIL